LKGSASNNQIAFTGRGNMTPNNNQSNSNNKVQRKQLQNN